MIGEQGRTLRAVVHMLACRSHATTLAAPVRAAMAANSPVPHPMSSACTSPSAALTLSTALSIASWYACSTSTPLKPPMRDAEPWSLHQSPGIVHQSLFQADVIATHSRDCVWCAGEPQRPLLGG